MLTRRRHIAERRDSRLDGWLRAGVLVANWPYSTFHRYVDVGLYPKGWAGKVPDLQAGEREQSLAAESAALFRPTRWRSRDTWREL